MNNTTLTFKREESIAAKNIIGNYRLDKTIGEGTFGKVKLGFHIPTQEQVAIKILEKEKIQDQDDLDRIAREINFLKRLKHQNIIKIYEIIENCQNFYLIMEYAKEGELFNYIVQKKRLDEIEASFFYCQILNGLEHIHKNHIVHRDLKPENLLLTDGNVLKIIDFGLSNQYKHGQLLQTPCGSPCYAAPEMILGRKYKGLMVDLWSTGIILYAMVCGYLPFEDKNNDVLYKKVLECKLEFPDYVSPCCRDLITKILTVNPRKRIKIDEIWQHPFLKAGEELFKKEETVNEGSKIFDMVLEKMVGLGYDKTDVILNIENSKHNSTTTTYDLLVKKFQNSLESITDGDTTTMSKSHNREKSINISINTYSNIENINININETKPGKFNENPNEIINTNINTNTITNTNANTITNANANTNIHAGHSTVRNSNKANIREYSVKVREVNTQRAGGYKKIGNENSSGREADIKSKECQDLDISKVIKKNTIDSNVIIGGASLFTPVNHRILYEKFAVVKKEIQLTTDKNENKNSFDGSPSPITKINTSLSYDTNPLHFDSQKAAENPNSKAHSNKYCNSITKKYIPSNTINLMDYSGNTIENFSNLMRSNDRKRRQMNQSNQHKFSYSISSNDWKLNQYQRSFSSCANEDNYCSNKNECKTINTSSVERHDSKKRTADLLCEDNGEGNLSKSRSPVKMNFGKTGNCAIKKSENENANLGRHSPNSKVSQITHNLSEKNTIAAKDPNNYCSNNVTQTYFPLLTETYTTSQTKFAEKIFPHATRPKTQVAFPNAKTTDKETKKKRDLSKAQQSSRSGERKPSEMITSLKSTEVARKYSTNESNPFQLFSRTKSPGGSTFASNTKKRMRKTPAVVDINISDASSNVVTKFLKTQSSANSSQKKVSNKNIKENAKEVKTIATIIQTLPANRKDMKKISNQNNVLVSSARGHVTKKSPEKRVINMGVVSLNKDIPTVTKIERNPGKKSSTKGNVNITVGSKVYDVSSVSGGEVKEKGPEENNSSTSNILNLPMNNNSQISDFAFCSTCSSMEEIESKLNQFCSESGTTLIQVKPNQYHCIKDNDSTVCIEISKMGQSNNILKLYHISGQELITKEIIKKIIINIGF